MNIFYSYKSRPSNKELKMEHVLRFGDIIDIHKIFNTYGKDLCKEVWLNSLDELFDFAKKFIPGMTKKSLQCS